MIFFVVAIFTVALCGASFSKPGEFNGDYLSISGTNAVKGIFVLLIFISHSISYVTLNGPFDGAYTSFRDFLNQLVVVMFFFYSGYGINESIRKKGMEYVKSIPYRRLFKVVLHFWMAILAFAVYNLIMKKEMTLKDFLLALTGWGTIGNSNWYMFAIFFLYIFTFLAFFIFRKPKILSIAVLTVLCVGFMHVNKALERPMYSYDTVMMFPLGALYSYFKKPLEKFIQKNDITYSVALMLSCGAFAYGYSVRWKNLGAYTLFAAGFTLLFVFLTMKIRFSNNLLEYFGKNVFGFYIFQRIPMNFFSDTFLAKNKFLFIILNLFITFVMVEIFNFVTGKIDKLLFDRKKKEKEIPKEKIPEKVEA